MKKTPVLGMQISQGPYTGFVDEIINRARSRQSAYVCVANVHMLVETYQDQQFASIVNGADLVTPDGKPLTWALRLLRGVKQDRVAGMDLLPDLLEAAQRQGIAVFFYGGQSSMLERTEAYVRDRYPELKLAGSYSPPFRALTAAEESEVAAQINASGAQLVFVILGCPKQERWMASMRGRVQSVMVGVGGALPVMIGTQQRAPQWMQRGGLEWVYRLAQEPRRLFRRYAVTNSLFLFLLSKAYLRRLLAGEQKSL